MGHVVVLLDESMNPGVILPRTLVASLSKKSAPVGESKIKGDWGGLGQKIKRINSSPGLVGGFIKKDHLPMMLSGLTSLSFCHLLAQCHILSEATSSPR